MPTYRFCRPDDIPRLVRAVHECFEPHFSEHGPGIEPLTVEGYRREMKEISLWPSNSMLAVGAEVGGPDGESSSMTTEGATEVAVGVLTATKREHEVLITRVGVRPGHQRQGHGSHMLTSLSQKLAVLGPPRLVAEVPTDREDLLAFFAACDYRPETTFTDWRRSSDTPVEPVPQGLVTPVTAEELIACGSLEIAEGVAWERTRQTIEGRAERLRGVAIVSPDRVEGWILALDVRERDERFLDVVAAGVAEPERRELLLSVLLRHLAQEAVTQAPDRALRCPRLLTGEMPEPVLRGLGFEPTTQYARLVAEAKPL